MSVMTTYLAFKRLTFCLDRCKYSVSIYLGPTYTNPLSLENSNYLRSSEGIRRRSTSYW